MPNPIQIKRGTKASLPTLAAGELAFTTDTFELFGGTGAANKFLGGGATAWPIGITGNAATATILQNARTINGVSFNGSANITLPTLNSSQARTVTVSTSDPSGGSDGDIWIKYTP